jgi:hypothetical protein
VVLMSESLRDSLIEDGIGGGQPKRNRLATRSLICSLVSLPPLLALYVEFIALIPAVLGVILGAKALGQIHRSGGIQQGRWQAVVAIVTGVVSATLAVVFSIVAALAM